MSSSVGTLPAHSCLSAMTARILFICLVLATMASCSNRDTKNLWTYLGEFSSKTTQKQRFAVDVKNFDRNHWYASVVWDHADKDVQITIVMNNSSTSSISTWQTIAFAPTAHKTIEISPQKSEVVKGSLAAFVGLDPTLSAANLGIFSQDSDRLVCLLEVEIAPVSR